MDSPDESQDTVSESASSESDDADTYTEPDLYRRACMGTAHPSRLVEAQRLIDDGVDVDRQYGPMKDTALRAATVRLDYAMMQLLLMNEADPDIGTNTGCTSLHMAAYKGDIRAARVLHHAAVNVSVVNTSGLTPLDYALHAPDELQVEMVTFLINVMGADPNARNPHTGETTLRHAVESTRYRRLSPHATICQLIKCGSNVCVADTLGVTPLHITARLRNHGLVRLLLSQSSLLYNVTNTAPNPQASLLYETLEYIEILKRYLVFAQGRRRTETVVSHLPAELVRVITSYHAAPTNVHQRGVQDIAMTALAWV